MREYLAHGPPCLGIGGQEFDFDLRVMGKETQKLGAGIAARA